MHPIGGYREKMDIFSLNNSGINWLHTDGTEQRGY
jgi:hypothetical protein